MKKRKQVKKWQIRIAGYGSEAPDQILAHPLNARVHPLSQQEAVSDLLSEVGIVREVVISRQSGYLLDGHLRVQLAEAAGQQSIPVLYVDIDPEDEALLLATLDPLVAQGRTDEDRMSALLEGLNSEHRVLDELLQGATAPAVSPKPKSKTKPEVQKVLLGQFRFSISEERFQVWKQKLQDRTGDDPAAMIAGIRKLLGMDGDDVAKPNS